MRVLSVHSHKGGAGKTTLALLMARRFAELGKKVCVVDLDFLGAGISPAIQCRKPEKYLDEALLAAEVAEEMPSISTLVVPHDWGGKHKIDVILNTGAEVSVRQRGKTDGLRSCHEQMRRLLDMEEDTQIIGQRLLMLLAGLEGAKYDEVVLDCHPTLDEISRPVLAIQGARSAETSAVLLVATPDRAHVYGLLKEIKRRAARESDCKIELDRSVLIINKVERDQELRPYRSTLDNVGLLKADVQVDKVVGDEAPTLFANLRLDHYCRIFNAPSLSSIFAICSEPFVPDWPRDIVTHSGTKLCIDLFGAAR